ncbi:PIGMENT DEFECTIVE 337 [Hibiscus trionum]|uniref:PIGMENT DEFECTIVE 337 n=1 Tax=Hibiscus trionum TaxID=183268 RepID=A0A9W7J1M0_HIBTR|nr:PIGMENT DEFECTIVE 337 [Hibiscus trionum]
MSPPRKEVMMNGVRPTPLKINKESHLIQKPSSSADQQKRAGPIIIYMHSPKIIHTQARDFMALVQSLTGLSRSDHEVNQNTAPVLPSVSPPRKNHRVNRQEHNQTSSGITDVVLVGDVNNNNNSICSSYVPTTTVSDMNLFFADMPLFTPTSTDFFCSPRSVHKFGEMGTLNSPTLLESMKHFF